MVISQALHVFNVKPQHYILIGSDIRSALIGKDIRSALIGKDTRYVLDLAA